MAIKGDKKNLGLILSGQPLPVADANVFVTQPKIKDIVQFGEDDFLVSTQMLVSMEQFVDQIKQGNSELNIISDFQLLLVMVNEDLTVKKMILDLFTLIFPEYKVKFTENTIDFFIKDDEKDLLVVFLSWVQF